MNQPVRAYPLRVVTEPAVYVMGDKAGQKVYPHGAPTPQQAIPSTVGVPGAGGMGMGFNPQAMVAQQNVNMEGLERRRDRERDRGRDRSGSTSGVSVFFLVPVRRSCL
jgi:hypothetical protein